MIAMVNQSVQKIIKKWEKKFYMYMYMFMLMMVKKKVPARWETRELPSSLSLLSIFILSLDTSRSYYEILSTALFILLYAHCPITDWNNQLQFRSPFPLFSFPFLLFNLSYQLSWTLACILLIDFYILNSLTDLLTHLLTHSYSSFCCWNNINFWFGLLRSRPWLPFECRKCFTLERILC